VLRVEPVHWYSWSFRVLQDGAELTRVEHGLFRSRGSFVLDGRTFTMRRQHPFGAFLLEQDEREIARAAPLGMFDRGYEITFDRKLTLKRPHPFSRRYVLHHGDLRIGELRPERMFGRASAVDFPDELPLAIRVFLMFLVVSAWRRQRAAAGAGG
jgi:hypothetical protein